MTPSQRLAVTRGTTEALCEGLSPEDCQLQSMDDASPVKWHLAHTTWFFETFVLDRFVPGHRVVDPAYRVLFNSYYVGVGARHPRPQRGLLSRPSLDQVMAYRHIVNTQLQEFLSGDPSPEALALVELGIQHEQQHQELILTDLKHHFSCNPVHPAYRAAPANTPGAAEATALHFIAHPGGTVEIGHAGDGFAFDNEGPRHEVRLRPFEIASRLVMVGEYQAFVDDGGYRRPELWLSDGWDAIERARWQSPLYWGDRGDLFTLHGQRPLDAAEPVCHVSYYEADAYARWAGSRLPTEAEWEVAACASDSHPGTWLESQRCHPAAAPGASGLSQMFGDCWEWTASAYLPYPGFAPARGAVGEYNGKFMINQMVLRGGSCVTPQNHVRASYRNFFAPQARWQFTGIRLAR